MNWEVSILTILAASLVRPFILAAAAFAVLRIFRIQHPASKHQVWLTVLAGMALLPAASVLSPHIDLPALPAAKPGVQNGIEGNHVGGGPLRLPISSTSAAQTATGASAPAHTGIKPDDVLKAAVTQASPLKSAVPFGRIVVVVYFAGLAVAVSYRALGHLLLRRLVRRSRAVRGRVLRESQDVVVPVAAGLFRPVVMLPPGWRSWPVGTRRSVLAHEFAHIRRKDLWSGVLSAGVRCLLWFHPLVWWLNRRISELAEMACDAEALRRSAHDAAGYCRMLLEFTQTVSLRGSRGSLPGLAIAGRNSLSRRIDAVFAVADGKLRRLSRPGMVLVFAGIPVMSVAAVVGVTRVPELPGLPPILLIAPTPVAGTVAVQAQVVLQNLVPPEPRETASGVRAFVDQYCVGCHDAKTRTGLRLDDKDLGRVAADAQIWERVVRKLRAGLEPRGMPRPGATAIQQVVEWLESEIDRNAVPFVHPALPHRLNVRQYGNAIRDLFGFEFNPASLLPADETTQSFDNLAETHSPQQEQQLRYRDAALRVVDTVFFTAAGRSLLTCRPRAAAEEAPCVLQLIRDIASRAFREPASDGDISEFLAVYRSQRLDAPFNDGVFLQGMNAVLQHLLTHRKFLYRTDAEPADAVSGQIYRAGEYALASRLSYFLWGRGPDEQLLSLAQQGRLSDSVVLEAQVRRMLQDSRAETLASEFAGRWLATSRVRGANAAALPEFDLREAMRREVELFFDSIVREDRRVTDLLDADYTFVNGNLARHYGIPNVVGGFQRVTLNGPFDVRRGLLGKAALLSVTSREDRTSPTTRGKWILTTLLGTPPPDPPPNVPSLQLRDPAAINVPTFRHLMQQALSVRADCVSCHQIPDPFGWALENFDATGSWRTLDAGLPIDTSAELVDGTLLNGPVDVRKALLSRSDQFVQTLTLKLLTYGLGRTTSYRDMPVVRAIMREAATTDYRFSAIVLGIVKSAPFQMGAKP